MMCPCSEEMLRGCSHTSELTRCDTKTHVRCGTLLAQHFGQAQLANSWLQADRPAPRSAVSARSPLLLPGVSWSSALPAHHIIWWTKQLYPGVTALHPSRALTGTCSTSEGLAGSRNVSEASTETGLVQPLSITSSKGPLCLPDPSVGILVQGTAPESLCRCAHRERTLGEPCCLQRDKHPCQMSPIKLQVLYFNNKP